MIKEPTTRLSIDGKFTNFNSIKLIQKTDNHHEFKIILDHDIIENLGNHTIDKSKKWLGRPLTITFKETEFLGTITNIYLANRNGHRGNLIVKGYSPTIKLQGQPHYTSWANKTLQNIVIDSLETLELGKHILPTYKEPLEYQAQYNENHFQFLQRLAKQYNQWFYYDGVSIVFGKPKFDGDPIHLEYGADIDNLKLKIHVKDHKQSKLSYNASQNNYLSASSKDQVTGLNELALHSFNTSNEVFKAKTHSLPNIKTDSKYLIDGYVEQQQAEASANLHVLKGKSSKQGLTVGTVIKVNSAKINGKADFDIQNYGEYVITNITHKATHGNEYSNTFTAIPSGIVVPKAPKIKLPKAQQERAIVTDNADNQGRVKVRFQWQVNNQQTAWIPVMSNNAGSSDHHAQNRGLVMIPEVGDEVMIGFEHNNPNFPFVLGSLFHGENGAGGKTDNNIKSIITRSGHIIMFNDTKNAESITITDKNKNIILLDTANKSIKLKAFNKIDLTANDITLNATNNLTFNSANNAEINVSNNFVINTMAKLLIFAPYLKQTVSGFMHLFSGKALINSLNSISIESKEVQTLGTEKVFIHSDKKTVVNSKGIAEMHGTEKNSFTNKAIAAKILPPEEMSLAVVEFRTEQGVYNGEFGFDWLRIDDNGLTTEPKYEDIIVGGYTSALDTSVTPPKEKDLTAPEAFTQLKTEYDSIPIKPKTTPSAMASNYFVPYLNLYSKGISQTVKTDPIKPPYKAKLRVLVEIEEDLDKLEFDYDKKVFMIDKPILSDKTKTTSGKIKSADDTVEITCNSLIDTEEKGEIRVYAYPKGSAAKKPAEQLILRKLAGKIKVGRNDKGNRKKINIAFVNVETNIRGSRRSNTGIFDPIEKENLRNTLYQGLVYANIVEKDNKGNDLILDLSKDKHFKEITDPITGAITRGKFLDARNRLNEDYGKTGEFFAYLRDAFINDPKYTSYSAHFTVFVFDEPTYDGTIGQVHAEEYVNTKGITKTRFLKNVALFKSRDFVTLNHEFLHGLQLYHTHKDGAIVEVPNAEYVYPHSDLGYANATDNVMTYRSTGAINTWKWQQEIYKTNI